MKGSGLYIFLLLSISSCTSLNDLYNSAPAQPQSAQQDQSLSKEKIYGWTDTYWGMPTQEVTQKFPQSRLMSKEQVKQYLGFSQEKIDETFAKYDEIVIPRFDIGLTYPADVHLTVDKIVGLKGVTIVVQDEPKLSPELHRTMIYENLQPMLSSKYGEPAVSKNKGFSSGSVLPDPDWSVEQHWFTSTADISIFGSNAVPITIFYSPSHRKL